MRHLTPLIVIGFAMLLGCRPMSPIDRLEAQRGQYTVELTSFILEQEPLDVLIEASPSEPDAALEETTEEGTEGGTEEGTAEDTEEGTDELAVEPMLRTNVVLDLLVSTEGDPLPGISVDFEHVDANRNMKERRLLWLETAELVKGVGVQLSAVVDDVDYQEGDGFHVEVRSPVPEAERSEYRELASASH
jgi:hypothetical protein